MKCAVLVVAVVAVAVAAAAGPARAAAQLAGMPVWNSPRGGTGVLVAADIGVPDSAGGKGTTLAGRAALGLSALTLSATVGVRNPQGAGSNVTQYGGAGAYPLIGGSLISISLHLPAGVPSFTRSRAVHTP